MKIAKWGNSLAVRIPAAVSEQLGFQEGDEVKIDAVGGKLVAAKQLTKEEHLERLRQLRGMIPADYRFKRDDAYEE